MKPKKLTKRKNLPKKSKSKKILHSDKISTVRIKCTNCGRKTSIRTSNPERYTKEVRKNYICIMCKC